MQPLTLPVLLSHVICPFLWAQEFILSATGEEIDQQITIPYRMAFSNGDVNLLMTICTPNTI